MRVLFYLLILCGSVSAQTIYPSRDSAFVKILNDLPATQPFDTAYPYYKEAASHIYILSGNDIRRFGMEKLKKYKNFNFTDFHILGIQECKQCVAFCKHDEGGTACHRNLCNLQWVWKMRENKKAFTEISLTESSGDSLADSLSAARLWYKRDTVIRAIGTGKSKWLTEANGDCQASYSYNLFTDKYYAVLLLKETEYSGVCAGMYYWNFLISFTMPPNILYTVKCSVRAERPRN